VKRALVTGGSKGLGKAMARAFAEARDGRVRDRRARLQRRDGIGDAEAEVLMTVDLDGLLQAIDDLRDDDRDGFRGDHAHRVGDRQRIHVAFRGDLRDDVQETAQLRAGGVDGEEDGIEAGFLCRERRIDGRLHRAVERPAVCVLDHVVARGDLDHHALYATALYDLNLIRNTAGERKNLGFQPERRDVGDCRLVLLGDGRHAGLDAVDAHRVELLGDGDLFLTPEDDGRLLLAIAQRDVVNLQIFLETGVLPGLGQVVPQARVPLVRLPRFLHVSSP